MGDGSFKEASSMDWPHLISIVITEIKNYPTTKNWLRRGTCVKGENGLQGTKNILFSEDWEDGIPSFDRRVGIFAHQ